MTVQIKSDAQFDDEKNTVHYDLNIVEGELYKMGELEIFGLDTQATARMQGAWTLREGQPYNADYPKNFGTIPDSSFPAACGGSSASMKRWKRRTRRWTWRSVSSSSNIFVQADACARIFILAS